MLRMVNILFIGVLLLAFILIMTLGDLKSKDSEEKILLEREIGYSTENLNLLNYLRTPVEYDINSDGTIESTTIASLLEKYYLSEDEDLNKFIIELTSNIFERLYYCNEVDGHNYVRGYQISVGNKPNEKGGLNIISKNMLCTYPSDPTFEEMCIESDVLQQKLKENLYVSLILLDSRYFGECFEW